MQCIAPREAASDFIVPSTLAISFGFEACGLDVVPHVLSLGVGGQCRHQWVFRRQHHETDAINRIRPSSEDLNDFSGHPINIKFHSGSFASADPIALGLFDAVRPINFIQS